MDTMNIEELKTRFLELVAAHKVAVAEADHRMANRIHGKLTEVYKEAKVNRWISIFLDCIDSSDGNVSLWAATFSLTCDQSKAEEKLTELAKSSLSVALDAETTLQMWRKGLLNLL